MIFKVTKRLKYQQRDKKIKKNVVVCLLILHTIDTYEIVTLNNM